MWLIICGGILSLGTGCSGINSSAGVSPASFFLPGLLQADPPPAHPDLIAPPQQPPTEAAEV